MDRNFQREGKAFEIREEIMNDGYSIKVFLNNELVSPEYSATLEIGQDYFAQHRSRLIDKLVQIAESDVRNGMYFKY